jgi:aspartyl-tRNA(Asn)/glutamyl-tRNA(Gln) amidotransferase subunit B
VEKTIRFGQAINATVNEVSSFDRKNYSYPDLPSGYQITQYYNPIIQNGKVSFWINNYEEERTVKITEAHMEHDTAKTLHMPS